MKEVIIIITPLIIYLGIFAYALQQVEQKAYPVYPEIHFPKGA